MTDETILVPSNVNYNRFGKLFSYAVDGIVVAQPLYVPNVTLPGLGTHNVLYIVTQHDSIYAFDADNPGTGAPLWHVSFLSAPGVSPAVTTVPVSVQGCSWTGFTEMGIMGTPAIDTTTGTIYLSVKTQVAVTPATNPPTYNYYHTLHALDITNGAEKSNGPVQVDASVVNELGNTVYFHTNALPQCQRPGLLLSNGTLFVAYGSNGCDLNSQGWVMAYDASNLQQQLAVFDTAPTPSADLKTGASLWMSGSGLAVDTDGSLFLSTANGPYDAISNWGDTILKLGFSSNTISVADYFTPYDQNDMAVKDIDLGSGGVTLLPDQPGVYPHLLVTSGKSGNIYVINRDGMGHYNPDNTPPLDDNTNAVQYLPHALGSFKSTPVYWSGNSQVYFAAHGDKIKAFQLVNGQFSPTTPVAESALYSQVGVPVISSNGSQGGILWNIHNPAAPALSALDATTLSELYNSSQKSTRDSLGQVAHFATPTIANNKVFVGTNTNVSVYGVFPYMILQGGNAQTANAGTPLAAPMAIQVINSQGTGTPGVSVAFTDNGANGTFSPVTAITDSTGTATTTYTVPTRARNIYITASSPSTSPAYKNVLLTATSIAGPATIMGKLTGVGQYGTAGTTLPIPYEVVIKDKYSNPIVGQPVNLTDNGAGGTFSANPAITGSNGVASVSYTLPKKSGYIVLTASYGGLAASAAEHSVAGPAAAVNIVSGNNQSAKVNTKLKLLVVSVTDQYGNLIAGSSVTFSDGGAGGTFTTSTTATGPGGQASTYYTTPASPKVVTITATASGLPAAVFTETVHQ